MKGSLLEVFNMCFFTELFLYMTRAPRTDKFYVVTIQIQIIQLLVFFNSRPCQDLNPGRPRYKADMLPTELSWSSQSLILLFALVSFCYQKLFCLLLQYLKPIYFHPKVVSSV